MMVQNDKVTMIMAKIRKTSTVTQRMGTDYDENKKNKDNNSEMDEFR